MTTFKIKPNPVTIATSARAVRVHFDEDALHCDLEDGRTISVPLVWYPRLLNATTAQRNHYQISPGGYGIHWPDVDEDLSVKGFLAGTE
jgi:uncharacterized protein DUF2442